MDRPASLHKLTVLAQLLDRLRTHTLEAQHTVIKAAGEEDLRYMLLNRYPLRLNVMPDTMAGVIRELETLLPDIKRIIEIWKHIYTMATAQEQEALNEVLQLLEATPDTVEPTGFTPAANDIPTKREKLAILVSTGKSKEAIGVQLTHEQVKRLTDKDVKKYSKRQEAYIGSKTTESLIDSFLLLVSKGLGMVVKVDDVEKLQQDLKNDYIINQELSYLAGGIALRCGRLLALANAALITTKHIQLEKEPEQPNLMDLNATPPAPTHPSRDSEGYPLEGFDVVG